MFHAVGVTPEAPTLDAVADPGVPVHVVDEARLREARASLCTRAVRGGEDTWAAGADARVGLDAPGVDASGGVASGGADALDRLDAVSLGTPHASLAELTALAAELRRAGVRVRDGVQAYVSTGRGVLALARETGAAEVITAAGFRIVVDTCTYVVPILAPGTRVVMTNSGKWAHYAPGNLGVDVVLGTLAECVASAAAGRVVLDE